MVPPVTPLADEEYTKLLAFRTGLRQFLRWSEDQAATVGLTPAQHQLLLAIRGHPDSRGPSVSELADYLCTRHHSAVQLIDRTEQLGLIARHRSDSDDRRIVRLTLTKTGRDKLTLLSTTHVEELRQLATLVNALVDPSPAGRTP
jgi:DNA-binding MarR family transcriptional regulator